MAEAESETEVPTRPRLTLPPETAVEVERAYREARVILEYGSGGSTALAAEMAGRTVFSVESDAAWMEMMGKWFAANPATADVRLHHGDIGPTKRWGFPDGRREVVRWPDYALSVWERHDFVMPDTVLVDGRFRVACFLTALIRCTEPVTLLWDDYVNRPHYHEVEDIAQPVSLHGRLARFELQPMALPREALRLLAESFMDPR